MMDFNATNEAPYHDIWMGSFVKFKFDSEFKKTLTLAFAQHANALSQRR